MKNRKTYKRRQHSKKKSRNTNKHKTYRRRGGVSFDERRTQLLDSINMIMIELYDQIQHNNVNNINDEDFINRIRALEAEADAIDANFGNHEMEDRLNEAIDEIVHVLYFVNENNNYTVTLSRNGSYMSNTNMNNISVLEEN